MKPVLALLFFCLHGLALQGQTITIIDSSRQTSIRGLSVVNDQVIWCSGNKGSVARSINGGKQFRWFTVAGYEHRDFRDIEAFDENTALIMGIDHPALILKTTDGGRSWKKVLEDSTPGMFLDAMAFDRKGNGCVIGDPVAGYLFRAITNDYGSSWTYPGEKIALREGETFFASSGSNIQATGHKKAPYLFVSGGTVSRLFYKDTSFQLDLIRGKESTGANAVALHRNSAIVVGGDFNNNTIAAGNCVLLNLGQAPHFFRPEQAPNGYRSCVLYYRKKTWLCCGPGGVDVSYDGGMHWTNISGQGFHVVRKAKKGKALFLAGNNGKIARLRLY